MLNNAPIINNFHYNDYAISLLRLDLIHPQISGNKWFKLKYNLERASQLQKDTIITFGGAFSNHIAATAYACKLKGFKCIGIIRGEASAINNYTLQKAQDNGMEFMFVSREDYKQKDQADYLNNLQIQFPNAYLIPEGGDNALGQKGCEEILTDATTPFTHVFCAYGTGTTLKGISKALVPNQQLTGIHVLKYDLAVELPQTIILNEYHFGGYAKHTQELLEFKDWFEENFNTALDYVYTAKVAYAIFDLIKKNKLSKQDKILMIHTGGLQGNAGYEARYNLKPSRQVNDPQG
ncbi:MAG: pyridoxal-phosphate dependent enzyme [Bacteroidota bacterium]